MKNILVILLAVIGLSSCGGTPKAQSQTAAVGEQKEGVEVLYFHGKKRCITCNAIEKFSKEVVENDFKDNKKVIFRVIDISTKEGEELAAKYEVTWSSLFINKWKEGSETRNNMTDFGFSYAKGSPEVFKEGVKKKIDELLP